MIQARAVSSMASNPLNCSLCVSSSSSFPFQRFRLRRSTFHYKPPNLKPLTSRIVYLTRRRQLNQIIEEVKVARKRYGKLNTIVMNAVLEACVHCGDIDMALKLFDEMAEYSSCGVDAISYSTLLKGLGEARRVDEAFQLLESVEQGSAAGNPRLSASLIYSLLNALIDAGDLRRAHGLLARYGFLLREGGCPSVLMFNLLMKGYIKTGAPRAAINLLNEIVRLDLKPDKLTYNTVIHACIKSGDLDAASNFLEEMKDKALTYKDDHLRPDIITYTTLVKGFSDAKDLLSLMKTFIEMKLRDDLFIDRTAFTAIVDAMLNCGSFKGTLCVFGEIIKRSGANPYLRPKPHLYLSMMRAFASQGDYNMVRNLHKRVWPDSSGSISSALQEEADHLLMEAALNAGQTDVALDMLSAIKARWKRLSWATRGGMTAVRIEALLGFSTSVFSPYMIPGLMPDEPIEDIMIPFEDTRPLLGTVQLNKVVMRFFKEQAIPILDDWGSCVGILHRQDCNDLNAPLLAMMRSPPPCVTTTTSIGYVVDLILEKKHKMVIVVKYGSLYSTSHGSRAVGAFTTEQLFKLLDQKLIRRDPRFFAWWGV